MTLHYKQVKSNETISIIDVEANEIIESLTKKELFEEYIDGVYESFTDFCENAEEARIYIVVRNNMPYILDPFIEL